MRSAIYHKLILEGSYEALLVNDNDLITEGSRTNIFFLRDDTLFTAPDNIVLNGITRKHILEICKENNINVKLTAVNINDIKEYDAVFMTGTSPIVLPFCNIGDFSFNVGVPLIPELRHHYLERAEESMLRFKSGEFF